MSSAARCDLAGLPINAAAAAGERSFLMSVKNRRRTQPTARKSHRLVRYAVVGLGHIAQAAVLPAFAHARKNSTLVAIVSDDHEKLRKVGRKYKIPLTATYDEYEALLESGDIDAVYIALPNDLHARYSIAAARHRVHVLCEKPMAMDVEQCRQMIAARDRFGIRMMVAYRLHFEKANLEAIRIARSGRLGDLRFFDSTFSFNVKPGNIRTMAEHGGGPLYDIGTYCINAARYLFRQEPTEVCALAATRDDDARFREIHEMVAALMRFPGDRLASFTVSFGAAPTATYRLVGDQGDLRVDNAYEYTEPITHALTVKGKTREKTYAKRDQFAPELLYFSDCIVRERDPEPTAEEGLIDVQIIEALRESAANGGRIVRLPPMPDDPHPDMRQEIRRPAVPREPALVNVESASEE
jgi:glucose-fructose oxidoreductase